MANLEKENQVMASVELLTEMETLEIHGGNAGGEYGPEGITYVHCSGAYCHNCACQQPLPKTTECMVVYMYCGGGTTCG